MIKGLINLALDNKVLVFLALLILVAAGVYSVWTIPIGTVPDLTNIQVKVLTEVPGAGPVEIEEFVTFPVEAAMTGLPKVKEIRSKTRYGLSHVTVIFEGGTDIYFARQMVFERLPQARKMIPAGFGDPQMGPIATGLGHIYQFELRARPGYDYDLTELRSILDWQVAHKLRSVKGVIEANAFGGKIKTYEVQVDPNALINFDVSFKDLHGALARNNAIAGGGYIVHSGDQRIIRGDALIDKLEDVADIVVATREDGTPIYVRDLGEVRFGHKIRQGVATRDARGEVVVGMAVMLFGENSYDVCQNVKKKVEEIQKTLPEGVYIDPYYDRSELVDETVALIKENIITGAVLVALMLMLMMGSLRAGLLVAAAIPLSALFMFICMKVFGLPANLMSLGAIDFGIIVDGAVVMVENCARRAGNYLKKHEDADRVPGKVFREAAGEVGRPILFSGTVVILVFTPILTLQGMEGKMFRPMAFTFMSALTGALIIAVTIMPVLAALFLARTGGGKDTFIVRWAKAGYEPLLRAARGAPALVLLAAIAVFGVSVYLATGLGGVFIPQLDEGDITLDAYRSPSASLDQAIENTTQIEKVLLQFPEVETVVSKTGRPDIPTDPMGPESSDLFVMLHRDKTLAVYEMPLNWVGLVDEPKDRWNSTKSVADLTAVYRQIHLTMTGKEELSEEDRKFVRQLAQGVFDEIKRRKLKFAKDKLVLAMNTALREYVPPHHYAFSQPIEMRFQELLTGARADISLSIYGKDLQVIYEKGEKAGEVIKGVEGASDVHVMQTMGLPTVDIKVKRDAISRYGINASDVLNAVRSVRGWEAGTVLEGEPRFPLQVRMAPRFRSELEDLKMIKVSDSFGRKIPLEQLAEINVEIGPALVTRKGVERRQLIGINIRGRDMMSFVGEARTKLEQEVPLPDEYRYDWGGKFRFLQRAIDRLMIAVPAAMFLVFMLLYITLRSFRLTVLIYLNVPMATTGGILMLWARGLPFSISAAVGFIALFGIAVMNGVVLVEHIRGMRKEGKGTDEAVHDGAMDRLRPVLMTACTDALGFLPMAIATGTGASVQRPLATVVIGGVITSTLLTLIVLPAIYHWFEPSGEGAQDEEQPPEGEEGEQVEGSPPNGSE